MAAAALCLAEALHRLTFADRSAFPYIFLFPSVVLIGAAFDRHTGSIALLCSTAVAALNLPPSGSFAIQEETDVFRLLLFALLSSVSLNLVEALYAYHTRAIAAQARAAEAEARALASEQEHSLLLAEFRHRVKNDLARLAATFVLRAGQGNSPETTEALRAAAGRVHLFATIYDQMALRKGVMVAELHDFLRDLVRDLNATIEREQPVGLVLDAESHTLPFGQASAIALIVNELVTNALKHAFPNDRAGTIRIGFRREGAEYVLMVADDGIGMPATAAVPEGQGSRIVRALAAQLGGRLHCSESPTGGTLHLLRFPVATDLPVEARKDTGPPSLLMRVVA